MTSKERETADLDKAALIEARRLFQIGSAIGDALTRAINQLSAEMNAHDRSNKVIR